MSTSPLLLMPLGLLVGFLMGLTGCTGAILVPALVLCFDMAQAKAQGTAVAITLSPLQLPALWTYYRLGNVDWRFMGWMTPGVIVGAFCGAWLASRLPPIVLKSIFGLLLVYVGAYMLLATTTHNAAKAVAMALLVTLFTSAIVAASRWHEAHATVASL